MSTQQTPDSNATVPAPAAPVAPAPAKAASQPNHHAAHEAEIARRHRERLGFWMGIYDRMPLLIKLPIILVLGLLYQPMLAQNMLSCVRASKTGRLRAIHGSELVLLYPLGLYGMLFSLIAPMSWVDQGVLCWLWLAIALYTIVTVTLDFVVGRWVGVILAVAVVVLALGWYGQKYDIPLLNMIGSAMDWFALKEFPRNLLFAFSLGILLLYAISWTVANFVEVFMIHGNMVTVWTFLHRSPSDTRASFSIVPNPRDLNELILAFSIQLKLVSKSARVKGHNFDYMPGGLFVESVAAALLNAQEVTAATGPWSSEGDAESEDDDA